MATNQNEEFVQHFDAWWSTTRETFLKKVLSKYLQLKPIFIFSIISLETLDCHSTKAAIKKTCYCRCYCYEHYCEFSALFPSGLWRVDFLNIFRKLSISIATTTNKIVGFGQKWKLAVSTTYLIPPQITEEMKALKEKLIIQRMHYQSLFIRCSLRKNIKFKSVSFCKKHFFQHQTSSCTSLVCL